MKEILFRGKRLNNGEWVEGYFIRQYGSNEIITADDEIYHITPDSLCEYTGLKDKNGTRLFEGDIVRITGFRTTAIAAVKYGSPSEQSTSWGWYFEDNDGHTYFLMSKTFCKDYNAIIIGNIHDNPELLKGE